MKRLLSLLLALLVLTSLSAAAFADAPAEAEASAVETLAQKPGDSIQAEETEWCFRIYLGRYQMRLWSITYGKWLTEWIDVGPAP